MGQSVLFGSKADGNGNGTIDAGDYQVWKTHFGETLAFGSASSSPINVPGPHSFILAFQILLGVLISIRRHHGRDARKWPRRLINGWLFPHVKAFAIPTFAS